METSEFYQGKRVLTAAQMKQAEAAAVAAGGSYQQLMENAGTAAAQLIMQLAKAQNAAKRALLLCGKGNNAGDAFVAARLLHAQGWRCTLLALCGQSYSPLAQLNIERLPDGVDWADAATTGDAEHESAAVIIDGVFGTGFGGALPPVVSAAFEKANAAPALRLALDIPSGLDCDSGQAAPGCFCAHHTLTFGAYKPGLIMAGSRAYTGEVHCLEIGL